VDDATRSSGGGTEDLETVREEVSGLVGEVAHAVLGVFRSRALPLADRMAAAGGDPFEVIDVVAATLRALADGLETPDPDWIS